MGEALNFSTMELHTDGRKALAVEPPEGVLKGSGRTNQLGSVSSGVYRRIATKGARASDLFQAGERRSEEDETASEQNKNLSAASARPLTPALATLAAPAIGKPDSATARETLRVGARVLAAYWNEKREFEGFWLAARSSAGSPANSRSNGPTCRNILMFKSRPQHIEVPRKKRAEASSQTHWGDQGPPQ